MISTAEPQWIMVNNHALDYFGGVPTIVVCDNCKQAVTANKDWIDPDLNKDMPHGRIITIPSFFRQKSASPNGKAV